jgi:hypothetical protein
MSMAVTSVEDVLNASLRPIGYRLRIGSIYDGSDAANAALDIYSQTLDATLRVGDWGFAQKIAAATLSGQTAPPPWAFEYTYPTDCIRVRNVFYASYLADQNNPLPSRWDEGNNGLGNKVIWTTATAARFVYTKQVVDMTQWEPLFVEALIGQLGERLAPQLMGGDSAKMAAQRGMTLLAIAEGIDG